MWRPLVTSPVKPSARSTCFTERARFRAKVASDVYVLKVFVFRLKRAHEIGGTPPPLPSRTRVLSAFCILRLQNSRKMRSSEFVRNELQWRNLKEEVNLLNRRFKHTDVKSADLDALGGAKHSPPGHQGASDYPRPHPPVCEPGPPLIQDISAPC